MKILHVNNNFHFLGGTEQYLYGICSEMSALGHKNIVMHDASDRDSFPDSVDRRYVIPSLDNFSNGRNSGVETEIRSVINNERPDIIYLHNIHNPYVVHVLTDLAPVVKYVHDHEFYCPKGIRIINDTICCNTNSLVCFVNALRSKGYRCMGGRSQPREIARKTRQLLLNKKAHRKINKFVVASHHMKENLISLGYSRNKIAVIPYFTDIPDNYRDCSGSSTVLYTGRISPEKGLDMFIDLLPLVKEDFRFTIAGDGDRHYVSAIRERINKVKLQDRIDLVGWVDNNNLPEYYVNSSFLVVPSIWPEPFGIVGIESMAYGRPVLAFNVGGIPEWLENGKTGFLIERGNKREFADKINLLLKDSSLRRELGLNAHKRASALFSKKNHMDNLIALFNNVAEEKE